MPEGDAAPITRVRFAELAGRIIGGDRDAAEELVRTYTEPFIRAALGRWGVSIHTAQDLTQEALAKIIAKLETGNHRPEHTGWGRTVLDNVVREYLRSRQHRVRPSSLEAGDARADALRDPNARRPISILDDAERERLIEDLRARAREEFQKTTGKRREILDLYLAGVPMPEIARRMGMELKTCHVALQHVKERIVAKAQALALGAAPPQPKAVTREALSDTFSRLPKHQRLIARLRCFDGLDAQAIAAKTGYALELVEANLDETWKLLTRRYHREFPDALSVLADANSDATPKGEA